MKFYILAIALVLTVAEVKCDAKDELGKLDMACREETKITEEELKSFFKGEMKEEPKEALKCHLKCLMEKQGHLKNGAFDDGAAKRSLATLPNLKDHQDAIHKAMDECKNKKGNNDCDTAFLITKCMGEHKAALL